MAIVWANQAQSYRARQLPTNAGAHEKYERANLNNLNTQQRYRAMKFSLILITFNQESYVKEALESALGQTFPGLEVVVSDDASVDQTWDIITKVIDDYRGPHKVVIRRNMLNLGIVGNFLSAISASSGDWIVAAAGDDVSCLDRLDVIARAVKERPNVTAAFSAYQAMEETGADAEMHWFDRWRGRCPSLIEIVGHGGGVGSGATYCYRRDVFDFLAPPPSGLVSEDRLFPFKAKLLGDVLYIDRILVRVRKSAKSTCRAIGFTQAIDRVDHRKHIAHLLRVAAHKRLAGLSLPQSLLLSMKLNLWAEVRARHKAARMDSGLKSLIARALLPFYVAMHMAVSCCLMLYGKRRDVI